MNARTLAHRTLGQLTFTRTGVTLITPGSDRLLEAAGISHERRSVGAATDRLTEGTAARQTTAAPSLEVTIISGSPIYDTALRQLLATGSSEFRPLTHGSSALVGAAAPTGSRVILVAPQSWTQLAAWLPWLRKRCAGSPWLILADLRLVGLFLSYLEDQRCAVIAPCASPEELRCTLSWIDDSPVPHLPTELLALFARSVGLRTNGARPRLPTVIELQCACGVSLRMSNREIAEALCLGDATVKSHLHRLTLKLQLSTRKELEHLVEQALACQLQPFRLKEFPRKVGRVTIPTS